MSFVYDKRIIIQQVDENEQWVDMFVVHSRINRPNSKNTNEQNYNNGSVRTQRQLTFEIRYFPQLKDIGFNYQQYRILYEGVPFAIEDYDDYMLQHHIVKLLGVSY